MAIDIRRPLKKFLPHLLRAKDEGLNEADTVQRIILCLKEVLGYDPLTDVSRESQIKDKYVDIAVKIDGTIRWLIEAKSAAVPLRSRHLDQAELYAAEGNHPWVVLTNGVVWQLCCRAPRPSAQGRDRKRGARGLPAPSAGARTGFAGQGRVQL